jgi:methylenetetrahydrofolate reductase (NADPH)
VAFSLSFEFSSPRTPDGRAALMRTARRLGKHQPAYYSVTYGAGGSTRDGTFETVADLCQHGFNAAPHLSIGTDDDDAVRALVDRYLALGVDRIVALRGDVPSGMGAGRHVRYAESLVQLLRAHLGETVDIEVAAYPEMHPDAPSPEADVAFFRRKVAAGANGGITQYFYNADAYFDFVSRARVDIPIVPGIMPITNYERLVRFSDKCGAEIPRWIRTRLAAYADDDASLKAFGVEVVTALCQRLVDSGAPGLHFYTLNFATATDAVLSNLRLPAGDG